MRGEPETVVDHVGVFLPHALLEAGLLFAEAHGFHGPVCLVQDHGRRGFVDLARLDADQAILDVIDAADAVLARDLVQHFDEGGA